MNTTTTTQSVPQGASPAGAMGAFTPILLMIVFFYFLIMRPQQKREARRKALIDSAKKGDKVITAAGIIGTIHKVDGEEVSLEVAENVRIRILKNSITAVGDIIAEKEQNTPKAKKKKEKESVEVLGTVEK